MLNWPESLNFLGAWLGYAAAVLTTLSFVPQAIKTLRTQETQAISLIMYILFTAGVLCWFFYGCYKQDLPMIGANLVGFVLAALILLCKLKNLKKDRQTLG